MAEFFGYRCPTTLDGMINNVLDGLNPEVDYTDARFSNLAKCREIFE
jgi:hypothetical protein